MLLNNANLCSNPNCSWNLSDNEIFCGLCGTSAATLNIAIKSSHSSNKLSPFIIDTNKGIQSQALLFYPQNSDMIQEHVLYFTNLGKRRLKLVLEVSTSYSLSLANGHSGEAQKLEFFLEPNRISTDVDWQDTEKISYITAVRIKSINRIPAKNEFLQIKSLLNVRKVLQIPLVESGNILWNVSFDDRFYVPNENKVIDLYPSKKESLSKDNLDEKYYWDCSIRAVHGAGILEKIVLVQANINRSELDLLVPSDLPKLIAEDKLTNFKISWSKNINLEPKKVYLEFYIQNQKKLVFPLMVHPTPPIDLYYESKNDNTVIVGPGLSNSFVLKFMNKGSSQAQFKEIIIQNPNVKLQRIKIFTDDTLKNAQSVNCTGFSALPKQVLDAYIPNPTHKGFDKSKSKSAATQKVGSLLNHIGTQVLNLEAIFTSIKKELFWIEQEPPFKINLKTEDTAITDHHHAKEYYKAFPVIDELEFQLSNVGNITMVQPYSIDFLMKIQPFNDDKQPLGTSTDIKITVDIPVAPMTDGEFLLIDYGTANTCVRGKPRKDKNEFVDILLDPTSPSPTEMKSVYRIKRFGLANQIEFGYESWLEIATAIPSTDWAAKLRLGTGESRYLKDQNNNVRFVTGTEAAITFLREVLNRVKSTGVNFKKIYLSSPAAFNDLARKDLSRALTEIGYQESTTVPTPGPNTNTFEFLLTEPEAYLYYLANDQSFVDELEQYVLKEKANATNPKILGFIFDFGGGTTDITLFEFNTENGDIEMLNSFGYRWLGGEALTMYMSSLIYSYIPEKDKYPFPKISFEDKTINPIIELLKSNQDQINNFGEIRKVSEDLKCNPDQKVKDITLYDQSGTLYTITIPYSEIKNSIEKKLKEHIEKALNDIFNRVDLMYGSGHLCSSYPEIVCMAGNSSKLWFLKDFILKRFEDLAINPLYHFNPKSTKLGVVKGLENKASKALELLVIKTKPVDGYWWYIRVGASYRLALPAGSALDHELTSYTADELTNSPHKLVIVIGTDHIPLLHSELAIHESDRSNDDVDFSSFQQHWTVPVPPECKGSKAACILKFVKNTPVFFYQKVNFVGKPISDWNYIFAEKTV